MDEIKRMQELAGINEYKIINPNQKYHIQDWVKSWVEQDYEDIKDEYGEDVADAIYMLSMIRKDNNNYVTDQELTNFVEPGGDWDNWSKDSLLNFLLMLNVIKAIDEE